MTGSGAGLTGPSVASVLTKVSMILHDDKTSTRNTVQTGVRSAAGAVENSAGPRGVLKRKIGV